MAEKEIRLAELSEKVQQDHLTHVIDTLTAQGFVIESRISLACSLGLHNWNGTKRCANCGATRGR